MTGVERQRGRFAVKDKEGEDVWIVADPRFASNRTARVLLFIDQA
jgi:hypothetical protein